MTKPSLSLGLALTLSATCALLVSCASSPKADPNAKAQVQQCADLLTAAKTIRVSGDLQTDPTLLPPNFGKEAAAFQVVIQRPASLAITMRDAAGVNRLAASGGWALLVDEKEKTFTRIETGATTLEEVFAAVETRLGFAPVAGEFLGSDPVKELMTGVRSGKVIGTEPLAGKPTTRLGFTQKGLAWDLYLAEDTKLPRAMALTFTSMKDRPRRVIGFTSWKLDAPVRASEFDTTPPAGYREVAVVLAR